MLDLYAGTGALGIEALSRGAGWVDFVGPELDSACAVIQANLERVGYRGQAQILCSPVSKAVPKLSRTYDLVFADPPYVDLGAIAIFDSPDLRRRLAPQAVIVYEHGRRQFPPRSLGDFQLRRTRSHGSSTVSFYAHTASEDSD